jgi:hypothetical protein
MMMGMCDSSDAEIECDVNHDSYSWVLNWRSEVDTVRLHACASNRDQSVEVLVYHRMIQRLVHHELIQRIPA